MASGEEGSRRSVSRWSELLSDEHLDRIVKKLPLAFDYLRFRCVCKSWRSVAKPTNLPPHFPLLMLHYHPSTERRSFLSVSTRQIRTLSIPELVNKVILAASGGWLLLLDIASTGGRLFLLNPLTRAEIQLPPTDDFFRERGYEFSPVHRNFLGIRNGIDFTLDLLQYWYIFPWHAVLLSSPNTAPTSCMAVISDCYARNDHIAFWKLGDESWTVLDAGFVGAPLSVAHHEGSLYMTDSNLNATVCEIASSLNCKPFGLRDVDVDGPISYLLFVTTSSQLLLLAFYHVDIVHVNSDDDDGDYEVERLKMRCKIYGLMPGNPPGWSLVESIHDNAVFRGFAMRQNFIVCTRDIPGCQEDCMYFSEPIDFSYDRPDRSAYEIDVLDLKTGKFEHLSFGQREPHSEKFVCPVWVELSLCKMLE